MFGKAREDTSAKTNKQARAECYKARDAFYECLREAGVLPSPGQAPPNKRCAQLRKAYENSCLPSWVAYFDEQQLRESARRSAALSQAIRAGAGSAAGGLAGKPQQ